MVEWWTINKVNKIQGKKKERTEENLIKNNKVKEGRLLNYLYIMKNGSIYEILVTRLFSR